MNNFIYCLDESIKKEYELQGLKLIKETLVNNQKAWIFANDNSINKCNFDNKNGKVFMSNKITF
jgi:uncharacterized protein YecT (DUF1311 family)